MNTLRSMKRILVGGLVTALVILSAHAVSSEKLAALRAKAEAGDGPSQYELGLAYADPSEPIANITEAFVWFTLAAENGAPGKAYMIVTNQMTPQQLADGKKLLEQRRGDLAAHRPIIAATPSAKPAEPARENPVVSPVVAAAPEPDNTAIKAELAKAAADLAAAKKESQQIKADLEKTQQAALEKLKAERDELAATVAKFTNEISTMRAAAANFEGERNALKLQIADATKSSKDSQGTLAADLAATNAKLKTAENELAKADANLKQLTEAKQSIAALNEQLQKLTAENQRLAGLVKQTETASAEKIAATEKALSETNSELLKAQASLAAATDKAVGAASLGADLAALRSANTDLGSQVQKLTIERDQARARAAKAANEARDQIEAVAAKLKVSEMNAASALAENAELSKQVAALQSAPPKQDPEVNVQLAKLTADLHAAQSTAAEEKEALAAKLKATEKAVEKTSAQNAELSEKIAALQAKPKKDPEAKVKLEKLGAELDAAKAAQRAADDEKEALASSLKKNEKALAKLTEERDELEQKLKATDKPSKKEAAAKAQVEQLKAELEAARATQTGSTSTADLDKAREEVAALQAKLTETEQALAAAKTATAAAAPSDAPAAAPAGDATAASSETIANLQKELNESQIKLDASLRSFQLQQTEIDRLQNALANIDSERANVADKLKLARDEAAGAANRATANNDAAAQLAGVREQLRQTQNQLASIAYENTELKHRLAFVTPSANTLTPLPLPATTATTAPNRPGSSKSASVETPAASRTHTVASGESLSGIAKRYYGSANRWPEILAANKGTLKDPAALRVGMKLKIP